MEQILRRPAVERATGHSRSTIYALMADGKFPRPVKIGARAVGWLKSEIAEYQATLIAERDAREADCTVSNTNKPIGAR